MYGLYAIKTDYIRREHNLALSVDEAIVNACIHENLKPKIVVLVSRIHRGTIEALRLARNLSDDILLQFLFRQIKRKSKKLKPNGKI